MDVVYVLIGFVCGFMCDAYIHFSKWKRSRNNIRHALMNMTVAEIRKRGEETTNEMIKDREELLKNENN